MRQRVFLFSAVLLLGLVLPARAASSLSLTVDYGPVRCGQETTFHLSAQGGSGQYRYQFNAVMLREADGTRTLVTDPTKMPPYTDQTTFSFTFFASGTYDLYFYVLDTGTRPANSARQVITVTIHDPDHPSVDQAAQALARDCLAAGCSTDYEKALYVHDALAQRCAYDNSYLYCGAEGALCRGRGTCESYHRAYEKILSLLGIETGRMEGNGHVWTAVKMDGAWYQVDLTWDAGAVTYGDWEKHLYFGLTDAILANIHTDHRPNPGYESNALADNWFIRTGAIRTWNDPFRASIQAKLDAGATDFTLPVSDDKPDNYKNVLYPLATYALEQDTWTSGGITYAIRITYADSKLHVHAQKTVDPALSASQFFSDVKQADWFAPAVAWAHSRGIVNGTTPTTFSPNDQLTVAHMTQLLYNAAGRPQVSFSGSQWYAPAQAWAVAEGYLTADVDVTRPCPRQQVVTMLYQAAGSPETSGATPFSDWNTPAGVWAWQQGVTRGYPDGTFRPTRTLSRAEAVQFLYQQSHNS